MRVVFKYKNENFNLVFGINGMIISHKMTTDEALCYIVIYIRVFFASNKIVSFNETVNTFLYFSQLRCENQNQLIN